ncbi:MAG: nitrogen fixation protein FixH [Lysobacteraceae bacterium]|nr:MAG: nitrogen fixation protein FixH [Xanthomonadaceae bacterium]
MDAQAARARPAWREPMVWLVAVIPAASVVASVALLVSAARSSGNNDAVTDQVRRTAQIQVEDLAPDLAARKLGLGATLRMDADRIELRPTSGAFPQQGLLRLALRHPLRADGDVELLLQPAGGHWQARHAVALDHDWNLTLSPPDGHWRLQGRLLRSERGTTLQPALATP